MKYLSVAQTAERWSISTRRIQILCNEERIPGAVRIGRSWAIPDDEPKPADARIKSGKLSSPKQMIKNRVDFVLLGASEQVRRDVTSEQQAATLTRKYHAPYPSRVRMGALVP